MPNRAGVEMDKPCRGRVILSVSWRKRRDGAAIVSSVALWGDPHCLEQVMQAGTQVASRNICPPPPPFLAYLLCCKYWCVNMFSSLSNQPALFLQRENTSITGCRIQDVGKTMNAHCFRKQFWTATPPPRRKGSMRRLTILVLRTLACQTQQALQQRS